MSILTPISTLTTCLMGIVYYTSAGEIKIAIVMENKVIYCGGGGARNSITRTQTATASAEGPKRFVTAATSAT